MPEYCTRANIENNRLPRVHLLELTDDERLGEFDDSTGAVPSVDNEMPLYSDADTLVNKRVTKCILDAQNLIDSFLVERYSLPLTVIPPLIQTICIDLAVYRLYLRRDSIPDSELNAKNDAMRLLERLQGRKISLPIAETSIASTANSMIAVRTTEKAIY